MAADLLALEALRAPAPSEAVLPRDKEWGRDARESLIVFATLAKRDRYGHMNDSELPELKRRINALIEDVRATTHPAPAPSEAVRKFSAAHTRAMSELEFTHGVGVRGDAPSEAVAWQLVHTRTGQRWTPATDRASVENQQREFAALGATETRIAALVDHHPAPARGVTVTEAMVERAMGVECGSTHHEHHPPDCRRCWQAKLTAALTPDAEGGA